MKIKERFTSIIRNHNTVGVISDEIEKTADDYAIEFGQWMASGVEFMDDTERGRIYYFKNKLHTTKELLEIFKKEKAL